jgi:hypothetical protein
MDDRATNTKSTARARSRWCRRKHSRIKRRARLRATALPIFLLVTTPSRLGWPGGRGSTLAIRQPQTRRRPPALARTKSLRSFRRLARGKSKRGEGIPAIRSNRGQAMASHPAAIAQSGPAALAGITVQKAMLALAPDFRRLILAFHFILRFKSIDNGRCHVLWGQPSPAANPRFRV